MADTGLSVRFGSRWRRVWRENPLRSALGKRILVSLLLLALVPLFVSNSIGYLASGRITHAVVGRSLDALTRTQAHHVRDEIERLRLGLATAVRSDRLLAAAAATLRDPRSNPAAMSGASRLASDELEHVRRQLDVFASVELVGPAGIVMAAAPPFASGSRWYDQAFLSAAAAEGSAFTIERSGSGPVPRLVLAVALHGPDTLESAVVLGAIVAPALAPALQSPTYVEDASASGTLLDETGRPLVGTPPGAALDYTRPLTSYAHLRDGQRRYWNAENREVLGSLHAVPGYPLHFLSEVPVEEALGGLRRLRMLSLVLFSAFVLVVIGVAWVVSRDIVRPVSELVHATERIARGDLGTTVSVAQRDELGSLGERFNDMARQLRESAERIEELHRDQMRRAEQLATVGELAAGIAHELKTPLLGISGGVQLLGRRLAEPDGEGKRIHEETMQRVRRMEGAIQDLLSYARPAPPHPTRLDLNAVVERALRLIRPRAWHSGVETRCDPADDLPGVLADPEQLGQVVVNLALNGIEAMPEGGVLEIVTRSAGDRVELWVSDTGPGLAPEIRDRVFRPFFTTKHTGTGLGLSIVRQVVEQHGGTVVGSDRPGGGARFMVSLPVHEDTTSGGTE